MLFDLHPKERPRSLHGRTGELKTIVEHIENRRWITVLGPRMVGKTSLVKAAGFRLERRGFSALYVNLWGGDNDVKAYCDGSRAATVVKAVQTRPEVPGADSVGPDRPGGRGRPSAVQACFRDGRTSRYPGPTRREGGRYSGRDPGTEQCNRVPDPIVGERFCDSPGRLLRVDGIAVRRGTSP